MKTLIIFALALSSLILSTTAETNEENTASIEKECSRTHDKPACVSIISTNLADGDADTRNIIDAGLLAYAIWIKIATKEVNRMKTETSGDEADQLECALDAYEMASNSTDYAFKALKDNNFNALVKEMQNEFDIIDHLQTNESLHSLLPHVNEPLIKIAKINMELLSSSAGILPGIRS